MITAEVVLRELHAIAIERAKQLGHDFTYEMPPSAAGADPMCAYVDADVPSCIIGEWLYRYQGISLETLLEHNNDGFRELNEYLDLPLDDRAIDAATDVQCRQDSRVPWAAAVFEVAVAYKIELEAK